MRNLKMKTKMLRLILTALSTAMLFTLITVSLIIYNQNKEASYEQLQRSISIIDQELQLIQNNLLSVANQILSNDSLASSIQYFDSMEIVEEMDMTTTLMYRELASSLLTVAQTANLSKAEILSSGANRLVVFYASDRQVNSVGYPVKNGLDVARLQKDENLTSNSWSVVSSNEHSQISNPGTFINESVVSFGNTDGKISLIAEVPITFNQYNADTDKDEIVTIGNVKITKKLEADFAERLSNLTGSKLNLYLANGLLSVGLLPEFQVIEPDTYTTDSNEIQLGQSEEADKEYFRGLKLIKNNENVSGIAAVYLSTEKSVDNTLQIVFILAGVFFVCVLLISPFTLYISLSMSKPLEGLAKTMKEVELTGDFSKRSDVFGKDEAGQIAQAFNNLMDTLHEAIERLNGIMSSVAEGDLSKHIEGDFNGEFNDLQLNTNQSIAILSQTVSHVITAGEQVHSGSNELTTSSQQLAKGSSEQAASLQEISSSMATIAGQAKTNSNSADQTKKLISQVIQTVNQGNQQMESMLSSINKIDHSSKEVSKIIKVIDEIAFQTNLLALNAAVEAARAGKYGKGFAVVAEEVRNLAAKSANSAKETTDLIEKSRKEVENGVKNADLTASLLKEVNSGIIDTTQLIDDIAKASLEQTGAVLEIEKGLEEVNRVVQQTSAISEQSASASAELSSQAYKLREMMAQFQVNSHEIV